MKQACLEQFLNPYFARSKFAISVRLLSLMVVLYLQQSSAKIFFLLLAEASHLDYRYVIITKRTFLANIPILVRMFHNFTFFEIKNAWGLIRSDLGHNEKIQKFFFNYLLF